MLEECAALETGTAGGVMSLFREHRDEDSSDEQVSTNNLVSTLNPATPAEFVEQSESADKKKKSKTNKKALQ